MRRPWLLTALSAVFAFVLGASAATAAVTPPFTVVMSGLDNPRGLAFGPEGALYVAESGRGGTQPCFTIRGETNFAGPTGAVSRLWKGAQVRVATGFPSYAAVGGVAATGPNDVAPIDGGHVRVLIGLGADPALRATDCAPLGTGLGWLAQLPSDTTPGVVDVAAYERSANPDPPIFESNPYGLLAEPGATIVADAAGNSLLRVADSGAISTLAVFPSRSTGRSTDSVPTSVIGVPRPATAPGFHSVPVNFGSSGQYIKTFTPTGVVYTRRSDWEAGIRPEGFPGERAYYVGELTGAPDVPGSANVYRVVPGHAPEVFLSGFTAIIDIAVGGDGSLYVLEFATAPGLSGPGDLVRVAPDGARTVVATGFVAPTSVAIGPDGAFYVSDCGIFPGSGPYPCNGQVVRIRP
jgi:hypothetical protein